MHLFFRFIICCCWLLEFEPRIYHGQYLHFLLFQVRPQAAGIRRSVQAHPEEEGQDHQEAGPQAGVHRVQVEEPGEQVRERKGL